jgi:hypothetical protein
MISGKMVVEMSCWMFSETENQNFWPNLGLCQPYQVIRVLNKPILN